MTSYKNIKEYSKTGSKLPFNMVKTMVNTTFGIQLVPADKKSCKSKFCNNYWSQFINESKETILHKITTVVDIDDDIGDISTRLTGLGRVSSANYSL